MFGAPMIRPCPGQLIRSFVTRVLCVMNSPQFTSAATGGGTIVHAKVAGSPTLLSWSVARTSNWCGPSASPRYSFGETQGPNDPVSNLHSNPLTCSLAENSNFASFFTVVGSGPESMVVSGATFVPGPTVQV